MIATKPIRIYDIYIINSNHYYTARTLISQTSHSPTSLPVGQLLREMNCTGHAIADSATTDVDLSVITSASFV